MILAIYSKINDEHDTEEEEEIEDFDQINQKLEEEMKINDKVGENGYDALPNDEKHENLDSLNNELVEEGLKELGEDVELE